MDKHIGWFSPSPSKVWQVNLVTGPGDWRILLLCIYIPAPFTESFDRLGRRMILLQRSQSGNRTRVTQPNFTLFLSTLSIRPTLLPKLFKLKICNIEFCSMADVTVVKMTTSPNDTVLFAHSFLSGERLEVKIEGLRNVVTEWLFHLTLFCRCSNATMAHYFPPPQNSGRVYIIWKFGISPTKFNKVRTENFGKVWNFLS